MLLIAMVSLRYLFGNIHALAHRSSIVTRDTEPDWQRRSKLVITAQLSITGRELAL